MPWPTPVSCLLSPVSWILTVGHYSFSNEVISLEEAGISGQMLHLIAGSATVMGRLYTVPLYVNLREFLSGTYPFISLSLGIILPAALMAVAAARRYLHL